MNVSQRLAQHASDLLTMDRYSHVQLHLQAAAVENLSNFLPPSKRKAVAE